MYPFTYQRPASLADASARLAANADAQLLAGGQTLIPTLRQRLAMPTELLDLGAIDELRGITAAGDTVTVGAMTPHAEVAASADVRQAIPALATLADGIGDPQVRNRGTIGGSIANADPAADYPAGVVGLGATVTTDKREVAADDFFTGLFETALEPGEIIRSVSFPVPEKAGYAKFAHPASRYAIVGVFVAKTGGAVRVAVTGAGPSVFRVTEMEQALLSDFSPGALDGIAVPADGLNEDIHATADYRASLVTVMAKRAVAAAS
jgi:carbon-monoxide dehydrogenase medium subunit